MLSNLTKPQPPGESYTYRWRATHYGTVSLRSVAETHQCVNHGAQSHGTTPISVCSIRSAFRVLLLFTDRRRPTTMKISELSCFRTGVMSRRLQCGGMRAFQPARRRSPTVLSTGRTYSIASMLETHIALEMGLALNGTLREAKGTA